MSEKIVGVDLAKPGDPGFVEVVVMDYSDGDTYIYRFRGDMTWAEMQKWLEDHAGFKQSQCSWMLGKPNTELSVYQAFPYNIEKNDNLVSYGTIR